MCGEGDSHRAEPREEFTRSPRGFLFVLLIPGEKLPSDAYPPYTRARRFPAHVRRRDHVSPLSPGQLPSWDAVLPSIIRRLYNHQNSDSICYSVTFRQAQQQCHGTDTTVPRSPSRPQRSREPQGIPWVCRARFSQPRSEQGHHRRAAWGEELSPRRVLVGGRGRSNRQGQKKYQSI